jgi:hypothetical protein
MDPLQNQYQAPNQVPPPAGEEHHAPMKLVYAAVFLLIAISAGFLLYQFRGGERATVIPTEERPQEVVLEMTERDGGVLPPPREFPADIPIETARITESSTATIPGTNIKQLTVSYTSTQTLAAKERAYRTYMQEKGFEISESPAGSPVRGLFGRKENADISVVLSSSSGTTLVQIAYILK